MILVMQNFNKLSIVIVNYRSEQYLDMCLASIYHESDRRQFEIIVVNNDQDTDLHKITEKYKKINLHNSVRNLGFGAACNYGAEKSTGDILFFLNPDTQIKSDYVMEILNKFMQSNEKVAIIGPMLITDEGETQQWCAGKDLTIKQLIKNNLGMTESKKVWESKKNISVDWVSGAALAIKKEIFIKIQGFDEKFFMYGEDLDLCRRVRQTGCEVIYCPDLNISHSGGKSRESFIKQKLQFFKSSLYYIIKKDN